MNIFVVISMISIIGLVGCKTKKESTDHSQSPSPVPVQPATPVPLEPVATVPPQPVKPQAPVVDHTLDFKKGTAGAPVTIEYFADLQCGACKNMSPILEQFLVTYAGKIQLIFKNFPKDNSCTDYTGQWLHEFSCEAAVAARCVGLHRQKFWEYKEHIFDNQSIMNIENFKKWAVEFGMTEVEYEACYNQIEVMDKVKSDVAEAQSRGVAGTPTIFVNGVKLYPASQVNIDAEIKKNLK